MGRIGEFSTEVELESLPKSFILQNSDRQLQAMAMIEKDTASSCRRGMKDKALKCLAEAGKIARGINGSKARCKHIEATIHRYSGEDDESLKVNDKAYHWLSNCAPGDDAS